MNLAQKILFLTAGILVIFGGGTNVEAMICLKIAGACIALAALLN